LEKASTALASAICLKGLVLYQFIVQGKARQILSCKTASANLFFFRQPFRTNYSKKQDQARQNKDLGADQDVSRYTIYTLSVLSTTEAVHTKSIDRARKTATCMNSSHENIGYLALLQSLNVVIDLIPGLI